MTAAVEPRPRIMVVEDEALVAHDIAETLERLDYEVVAVVGDADSADEAARELTPDLALLDVVLRGGRDGVDVATTTASLGIPVVFLTGHTDHDTVNRVSSAGPYGYVVKPYNAERLQSAIEVALRRHELEQRLRESEERYRITLASMGEAVVAVDADGVVSFVNPAAELLLARPAARCVGLPAREVLEFRLPTGDPMPDPLAATIEHRAPVYLSTGVTLRTWAGRSLRVRGSVVPLAERGGPVAGAVAVLRDGAVEGELDDVTGEAADAPLVHGTQELWASFVIGPDGDITECNATFASVLGVDASRARSVRLEELFTPPVDRSALPVRVAGDGPEPSERDMVRPDGTLARVVVSMWRSSDADGAPVHGQLADVTARHRARRAAEQARKMEAVGHLATSVAHEFSNLVTVIAGRAEMLAHELHADSTDDDLEEIRSAVGRAHSLVGALLSLSSAEIFHARTLDAEHGVREYLTSLRGEIGGRIEVRVESDAEPCLVFADNDLLRRAMGALIDNAVHAMPDGGRLTVRLSRAHVRPGDPRRSVEVGDTEFVLITVEDTGVGMSRDDLAKATAPFHSGAGRAGLGLTRAQGFAARSGGWLELQSRPGVGTRATIGLPMSREASPRRPPG